MRPTEGWATARSPESQGLDAAKLAAATAYVGHFSSPDAFVVVRGGEIVAEKYWRDTTAGSLHDLESGTKSVGAIALAHAVHAGHFSVETNLADVLPSLTGINPTARSAPLQLTPAAGDPQPQ